MIGGCERVVPLGIPCTTVVHPSYIRRTSVVHPSYIPCTTVVHAYGLRSPQGACTGTVPALDGIGLAAIQTSLTGISTAGTAFRRETAPACGLARAGGRWSRKPGPAPGLPGWC